MIRKINDLKVKRARGEKGFTLIELLIVVAIIGILAAIAIPQFSSYRIKSYNSNAQADLRNMMTGEEAYFTDNNTYVAVALTTGPAATVGLLAGTKLSNSVIADVAQATTGGTAWTADYWGRTVHTAGDRCYSGSSEEGIVYAAVAVGATDTSGCPAM